MQTEVRTSAPQQQSEQWRASTTEETFLLTYELQHDSTSFVIKIEFYIFIKIFDLIQLEKCKNYEIRCLKLSKFKGQKKVYINKIEFVGHDDR